MRTPYPWIQYNFSAESRQEKRMLFRQVHGDKIIRLSKQIPLPETDPEADGAYTYDSKFELRSFSADCLPILFFPSSPDGPIAAIHSGWKGAKAQIAAKAFNLLSSNETQLSAAFGPAIRACCFEVKEDFIDSFREAGPAFLNYLERREGKFFFDLPKYVAGEQLASLEQTGRINWEDCFCTVCSKPALPSYRRNKSTNPWICARIEKI